MNESRLPSHAHGSHVAPAGATTADKPDERRPSDHAASTSTRDGASRDGGTRDAVTGRVIRSDGAPGSGHENLPVQRTVFPPFPPAPPHASPMDRVKLLMAWWQSTRPARTLKHFGDNNGAILAGGLAYSAIFSVFAAIWAFVTAIAMLAASDPGLRNDIISNMAGAVPGLVGEDAVIKPSTLDQTSKLGWTGVIAMLGSLWTAMGWLAGARASIRNIFDVPVSPPTSFALLKLKDFGILIAYALALAVSSALTVVSTAALKAVVNAVGLDPENGVITVLLRTVSLLILLAADALILAVLIRVLTGLRIPKRTLLIGSLIGAVSIEIIKLLGTALLGGAKSNPIAASFAVLLGVLIFFNLLCTVLLLTSSWLKVTMDDLGASPRRLTAAEADAEAAVAELQARRERLAADRIRLQEELRRTPRFFRSKLRREFERVTAEERALLEEDKRRRLGLDEHGVPDPKEPRRSEERGFTEDAAPAKPEVVERDLAAQPGVRR